MPTNSETATIPATYKSPLIPNPEISVPTTLYYSVARPGVTEKWATDSKSIDGKNFDTIPVSSVIYDIRGQENQTHIDKTGFQAITSPSTFSSEFILSATDAEIENSYFPEVEELIKKQTGASRVIFFDHTIRRPKSEQAEGEYLRAPVLRAHVDQSPGASHRRVLRHDVPAKPWRRFQIINVWRPLKNTVYDYPLAVCDFNSVDVTKDLVATNLIYPPPRPIGETYSVKHNENLVWWYWSEMTSENVLFLKCYDSASRELTKVKIEDGGAEVIESELRDVAGLTPHTAFLHEEGAKKGIGRYSIEVRTLVFYD